MGCFKKQNITLTVRDDGEEISWKVLPPPLFFAREFLEEKAVKYNLSYLDYFALNLSLDSAYFGS